MWCIANPDSSMYRSSILQYMIPCSRPRCWRSQLGPWCISRTVSWSRPTKRNCIWPVSIMSPIVDVMVRASCRSIISFTCWGTTTPTRRPQMKRSCVLYVNPSSLNSRTKGNTFPARNWRCIWMIWRIQTRRNIPISPTRTTKSRFLWQIMLPSANLKRMKRHSWS